MVILVDRLDRVADAVVISKRARAIALQSVVAGMALLLLQPAYLRQSWLHAKLSLVVILIGMNLFLHLRARALRQQSGLPSGQFRMLHGLVSALFLGIVVLVMIKPF